MFLPLDLRVTARSTEVRSQSLGKEIDQALVIMMTKEIRVEVARTPYCS